MFRAWLLLGSGFFVMASSAQAAALGVAGDSFDVNNPAYTGKLESAGYTVRQLENFDTAGLQGLDAVWLDGFSAFAFSNLDLSSPNLASFVQNGGKLIVQSPGFGLEGADEYPFAANLTVTTAPSEANIHIVTPGKWLANVSDAQLSNWTQASTSGNFTSIPDWTGLADSGTPGQWVTIARDVGQGSAVYTFQDMSRMFFEPQSAGAIAMLQSIVPVPEPASVVLFACGAGFIMARRIRRR